MASRQWQRTVAYPIERFPTEWAMYHGDEQEGGQAIYPLEDARTGALDDVKAELAGAGAVQEGKGRCTSCDGEVSLERLEAAPRPFGCVACQDRAGAAAA